MNSTLLQYLQTHLMQNSPISDWLSDSDAQQETLRLFVEIVEQAPIAISITDKKANILYVNKAFYHITGYEANSILGENQSLLSDKSTPKILYNTLWRTISAKNIWQGRLINRHKSGRSYLADLTIAPIVNTFGAITHYIGMQRDVTNTYEAEKKSINQKLLIESVLNSSPIAMVVVDDNDKVVLDNQLYKALVSDLDKGEPAHYFLQLLRDEMKENWFVLQSTNQGFSNREFCVNSKYKTRWYSCAGNWFTENEVAADAFFAEIKKKYLILTLTDITQQRHQLEVLRLQSLKTVMSEDERVRSIRETLLGAIHQIQMPMNQIMAAEQILHHKRDDKNKQLIAILQQIQQSGRLAVATMQDCVPEIYQGAQAPVNINQILHEVLLLETQRLLNHNIDVQWRPLIDLPNILGSENRLRILFKQFIDNAIEAMIQSTNQYKQLSISTKIEDDLLYVRICDSGNGIPSDKRSKIFEPFYTTHKANNTAGMGLVIAKEIISQHQGLIDIDSEIEQGCCFQLSFPLHQNLEREVYHD